MLTGRLPAEIGFAYLSFLARALLSQRTPRLSFRRPKVRLPVIEKTHIQPGPSKPSGGRVARSEDANAQPGKP
jgi:hypothetical protein